MKKYLIGFIIVLILIWGSVFAYYKFLDDEKSEELVGKIDITYQECGNKGDYDVAINFYSESMDKYKYVAVRNGGQEFDGVVSNKEEVLGLEALFNEKYISKAKEFSSDEPLVECPASFFVFEYYYGEEKLFSLEDFASKLYE